MSLPARCGDLLLPCGEAPVRKSRPDAWRVFPAACRWAPRHWYRDLEGSRRCESGMCACLVYMGGVAAFTYMLLTKVDVYLEKLFTETSGPE